MQLITGNKDIKLYEQLVQDEHQEVTHLRLDKGQKLDTHAHPWDVVVVIYEGKVEFTGETGKELITPGQIVRLTPNEKHSLIGIEQSGIMVIKSELKK